MVSVLRMVATGAVFGSTLDGLSISHDQTYLLVPRQRFYNLSVSPNCELIPPADHAVLPTAG